MKKLLLLFLLTFLITGFSQDVANNAAPDFVLRDLEGKNYKLSENLNQGPILINFWATWCLPCREEMKELDDVYHKFKDDGLEILAISIDDPKSLARVKSFIKSRNYPFKVLLDTNSEVMQLFQAKNPPYTVLLNPEGIIFYTHSGYRKGDEKIVEEKIELLLSTMRGNEKEENADEK
jgi:cytochrome c biogenesis protein CcmG/thiol:disulfide interchange protein DsbE